MPGYSHYMESAPDGRQATPCPVGAGPYESGGDFECRGAPRGRPIGGGREGGRKARPYDAGGDFECRGAPRGRPIGCGREGGRKARPYNRFAPARLETSEVSKTLETSEVSSAAPE